MFSVARGDSDVRVLRVVEFVAADAPCGNCDVLVADDVLAIDGLCCV